MRFEPRTRSTSAPLSSPRSTSPAHSSSSPSTTARPPPPNAKASTSSGKRSGPVQLLRPAGSPDVEHRREQAAAGYFFDLRDHVHARDDVLDLVDPVACALCPLSVLAFGRKPPREDREPAGHDHQRVV